MHIIAIGLQCNTTSFKARHGLLTKSYPFDWMYATSKFVYEMLHLLLEKNMNIEELVKKHFLLCDKKS
jgi:hypothetical protein